MKRWNPKWTANTKDSWSTERPDGGIYVLVKTDGADFWPAKSWYVWRGGWRTGDCLREVKQLETAKECARMDWEASQGIVSEPRRRGAG